MVGAKIEIRIGTILAAERVPETDKLWKLTVNLGEETPRTIVSGIAPNYPDAEMLVGKQCPFIVNLEPRIINALENNGLRLVEDLLNCTRQELLSVPWLGETGIAAIYLALDEAGFDVPEDET